MMIPTKKGKHLLMLNGYTFSQINNSKHWVCSSKFKHGCNVRLRKLPNCDYIEKFDGNHNHQPPSYVFTQGVYVKI